MIGKEVPLHIIMLKTVRYVGDLPSGRVFHCQVWTLKWYPHVYILLVGLVWKHQDLVHQKNMMK
jgi:hypothetical protein